MKKNKLVRCPYCRGEGIPNSYYDPPMVCDVCDDNGVVTLAEKMRYISSFRNMDKIEKQIFSRRRPEYDDYQLEDIEVLIGRYKRKKGICIKHLGEGMDGKRRGIL